MVSPQRAWLALTTPEKSFEALATQRLGPTGAMGAFIGREQATTECCCYSFASGENLTFGTLAARPKPAETLACSICCVLTTRVLSWSNE
jgi:hypothetical protein